MHPSPKGVWLLNLFDSESDFFLYQFFFTLNQKLSKKLKSFETEMSNSAAAM